MMNKIKKAAAVLSVIAATSSLITGCGIMPKLHDIVDFEVAQLIGIDKGTEPGKEFKVTLIVDRTTGSGESVKDAQGIMTVEAATVSDALAEMEIIGDSRHHLGYIDYILISEEAAKGNVGSYFDHLIRDNESRYSAKIYIVKGPDDVAQFLRDVAADEAIVTRALDNLGTQQDRLSNTCVFQMVDFIYGLSSGAAVLPLLEGYTLKSAQVVGGELPEKFIIGSGYAVFKDRSMVGVIDNKDARAYNILTDKSVTSPITVNDSYGEAVSVDLHHVTCNFSAQWDGKTLKSVTFSVELYTNFVEQHSEKMLNKEDELLELNRNIEEHIKEQIKNVIDKSRELKSDILGIADKIRVKNPIKWEGIEDDWEEMFPSVEIKYEVNSIISRPYDIIYPPGAEKGEAGTGSDSGEKNKSQASPEVSAPPPIDAGSGAIGGENDVSSDENDKAEEKSKDSGKSEKKGGG